MFLSRRSSSLIRLSSFYRSQRLFHDAPGARNRQSRNTIAGSAFAVSVVLAGGALQALIDNDEPGNLQLRAHCEAPSRTEFNDDGAAGVPFETGQSLTNWSSTHSCQPYRLFEPTNAQEVCRVLEAHNAAKRKIRPVGTALSPNGIGMTESNNTNLLSIAAIDYIEVDKKRGLVTVGAGARVADVLKELRKYGMTLGNFSSIQEQQLGGWTQVAAHGTGCSLPTVDEMIVRMKLATPTEGLLTLSDTLNPQLFRMAKVGLGSLGVVTELTLQCIPSHRLHERTFTLPIDQIDERHMKRLRNFRHVRYMWLPYTQDVVVVVSNPVHAVGLPDTASAVELSATEADVQRAVRAGTVDVDTGMPTASLQRLLLSLRPSADHDEVSKLSFSQLRDRLLDLDPLNPEHSKKVNRAEAAFWRKSTGERTADSTEVLGFDCGGEQWVLEICFPMGSIRSRASVNEGSDSKDVQFVKELLQLIEKNNLPAPCPIEQRWTARSTSPMSPAYSADPDEIFSWVGVIMYLPPGQNEKQREEITAKFREYTHLMRPLLEKYKAQPHWAKVELPYRTQMERIATLAGGGAGAVGQVDVPSNVLAAAAVAPAASAAEESISTSRSWFGSKVVPAAASRYGRELTYARQSIARRYPVAQFNKYRSALDPNFILSNELIDALFNEKPE